MKFFKHFLHATVGKNKHDILVTPEPEEEKSVMCSDLSPKQKLDNVLSQVRSLAKSGDHNTIESIFYIIKIYADKINRTDNTKLLESNGEYQTKENRPSIFFSPKYRYSISESFRIYLGKSAVITNIWTKARQINAFNTIGTCNNPFEERRSNNRYYFFMPIGLTYFHNGNHSANSGIIKTQGYIEYDPTETNCQAYDLTPLYDELYFDGEYFKYAGSDEICEKAMFEFGCLFEIGRILSEYNVNYFDYC